MNGSTAAQNGQKGWRPSPSAEPALLALIGHSIKLPAVPAIYHQLVTELQSPRGSIDFIARLVSRDPALCARILQAVNSAAFAPSQPITSPHDAVLFLGAETVKAIVLFEEMLAPLKNTIWTGLSLSGLWRHSLAVAALAKQIASIERAPLDVAETSFTAGLLHDAGKLVFIANMAEKYKTAADSASRQKVSLKNAEEQAFGVNHADLGALLFASWGMPQILIDAVGWHHEPCLSEDRAFSLLSAVHIANALDHELHRTPGAPSGLNLDYIDAIGLQHKCDHWRRLPTPSLAAAA